MSMYVLVIEIRMSVSTHDTWLVGCEFTYQLEFSPSVKGRSDTGVFPQRLQTSDVLNENDFVQSNVIVKAEH